MTIPMPSSSGSLESYINTVYKIPILSHQQEYSLARSFRETNDLEAAKRVLEAYQGTYTNAVEMMVEQAFLLWMRRTSDVADCVHFLNESGIKCDFSPAQKERLKEFKRLALIQIKASKE